MELWNGSILQHRVWFLVIRTEGMVQGRQEREIKIIRYGYWKLYKVKKISAVLLVKYLRR